MSRLKLDSDGLLPRRSLCSPITTVCALSLHVTQYWYVFCMFHSVQCSSIFYYYLTNELSYLYFTFIFYIVTSSVTDHRANNYQQISICS